jgi:hypothetical protein
MMKASVHLLGVNTSRACADGRTETMTELAGLTLGERRVPTEEVDGLQLTGERGHRVGLNSLEDSSPAEDFVHEWPHQLLSQMTRLFNQVLTEQTHSRVTTT